MANVRTAPVMTTLLKFSSVLLLGLCWTYAYAQTPQRTTATYADWTVSCSIAPNAGSKKTCAMVQSQTARGQSNPVSQVTIGQPTKNKSAIFFQVPANVWLQGGVTLVTDEAEPQLVASFAWCVPTRCIAGTKLTDIDIKKLRVQKKPGRLVYKNASQVDVLIPVSFSGFSEAMDGLLKE